MTVGTSSKSKIIPDIYDKIGTILRDMQVNNVAATTFTTDELYPCTCNDTPTMKNFWKKREAACPSKSIFPGWSATTRNMQPMAAIIDQPFSAWHHVRIASYPNSVVKPCNADDAARVTARQKQDAAGVFRNKAIPLKIPAMILDLSGI